MTPTRIYLVTESEEKTPALVRAANQAQAITHVVRGRFKAAVASQEDIVKQVGSGVKVQDASTAQQELPLTEA